MDRLKQIDWLAWLATIALIIVFREGAVLIMGAFHHPELGNLVGLISLLIVLFIWRKFKKVPNRLVDTNNKIMKESGFAFLPICAGSLMMLVHMGKWQNVGFREIRHVNRSLWFFNHAGGLSLC